MRLDAVDDVAVLHAIGALALALAPRMRRLLEHSDELRPAAVIVDLSLVEAVAGR